jgi:hypothetical protein
VFLDALVLEIRDRGSVQRKACYLSEGHGTPLFNDDLLAFQTGCKPTAPLHTAAGLPTNRAGIFRTAICPPSSVVRPRSRCRRHFYPAKRRIYSSASTPARISFWVQLLPGARG